MISVPKPVMVDPLKLKVAEYNPRKMSKREMASLRASIKTNGFVEPLVVQKSTSMLIGGHQRVTALRDVCKELGVPVPRVPAVVLDVDDRRAKLLNLALNRIHGDFNQDLLASLMSNLHEEMAMTPDEILSTGFSAKEIDSMLEDDDEGDLTTFASSVTLSLQFDSPEQRDAVKAVLKERAAKANKKSGTLVYELLGLKEN